MFLGQKQTLQNGSATPKGMNLEYTAHTSVNGKLHITGSSATRWWFERSGVAMNIFGLFFTFSIPAFVLGMMTMAAIYEDATNKGSKK